MNDLERRPVRKSAYEDGDLEVLIGPTRDLSALSQVNQPDPITDPIELGDARVNQFPTVRITNDTVKAYRSRVELDGKDISSWVHSYAVVGRVNELTVLRLELYVGDRDLQLPAHEEVTVCEDLAELLTRHGWRPPAGEGNR